MGVKTNTETKKVLLAESFRVQILKNVFSGEFCVSSVCIFRFNSINIEMNRFVFLILSLVVTLVSCYVGGHHGFKHSALKQSVRTNRLYAYNPWKAGADPLRLRGKGGQKSSNEIVSSKNVFASPFTSSPRVESVDALVVGSGISGSTAAFYLQKNGIDVMLTEARDVVGGNLISKRKDGYLWEEGPNSFQPSPTILRFAKDLGMIDKLVLADPTLPRFVFWEDKLYALPGGIPDVIFNFPLLTWPAKIRAGLGAIGLIASRPKNEESIQEFVTRHLGEQVFTRIIDPFVSGVYAGNPRNLSMKSALKKVYNLEDLGFNNGILSGALVRIQQIGDEKKRNAERDSDLPVVKGGSLGTFQEGLQSLPLAVQAQMPSKVRLNHKLTSVEKGSDGRYVSTFDTSRGKVTIYSKTIILTAPGYVTAEIVGGSGGLVPEASLLSEVEYPPVASVTIAYPNAAFKNGLVHTIKGFGHLIPR